jgi:hypothetical protein
MYLSALQYYMSTTIIYHIIHIIWLRFLSLIKWINQSTTIYIDIFLSLLCCHFISSWKYISQTLMRRFANFIFISIDQCFYYKNITTFITGMTSSFARDLHNSCLITCLIVVILEWMHRHLQLRHNVIAVHSYMYRKYLVVIQ